MTRRPKPSQPFTEEAHAAMARVFGVDVESADAAPAETTAPEPPADEAERRAALGRVFGTEA
ncbi:MAG: hypothetical protein ACJ75E_08140 [Actinomycetes bacterium]|jgi:hypothetical protein